MAMPHTIAAQMRGMQLATYRFDDGVRAAMAHAADVAGCGSTGMKAFVVPVGTAPTGKVQQNHVTAEKLQRRRLREEYP